jgi:heme/copper-type cytochrome/quinol oxidase subunit 2
MMWIALIVVLGAVVYFSWKSMEQPVNTKLPIAPKPAEPVKVEPVVAAAPVAPSKPKRKYGGKVKKEKK